MTGCVCPVAALSAGPVELVGIGDGGTVAALGDDAVGLPGTLGLRFVVVLAVRQDDCVGDLLLGAGVAQVADRRPLVLALLGPTVELDDRFLGVQWS